MKTGFDGWNPESKENDYLSFMTDIDIYIKLATLPDDMKKEVDDFVDYTQGLCPHRTLAACEDTSHG